MTAAGLPLVEDGDLIARLRELTPYRPVTWPEAHSIAERQAALLLDLWGIVEPPVPQFIISNLPGLVVDWRTDWPTEATSFKTDRLWRVVIRSTDVKQRQRFSLAHEFKHVLDDPFIGRLMANLPVGQRQGRAERLCNWFAACLLMPRPWIKHDWCGGLQNNAKLARRYYVSVESMTTRLSELGLRDMTLALEPGFRRHLPEAA